MAAKEGAGKVSGPRNTPQVSSTDRGSHKRQPRLAPPQNLDSPLNRPQSLIYALTILAPPPSLLALASSHHGGGTEKAA